VRETQADGRAGLLETLAQVEPALTSRTPEAPAAVPSGSQRYQARGEIGRGGMGRVIEGRDLQFGRSVAVKELHPGVKTDGEVARRFVLEALITGNLEHPGIPTVYERGRRDDGAPFYAMRRVRGRTLAQAIEESRSAEERLKLLPVVIRTAQALAYAHDRGVVHRDIKPHNIIVGTYGETVVLDWGIAKVRGIEIDVSGAAAEAPGPTGSVETAHGTVLGTPSYMAPEQARGEVDRIDERTDVFALGALLYHVLSGAAPYQGATVQATLARAIEADFAPLAKVAPDTPPRLAEICARALQREPQERYASAGDMAKALEAAAEDALLGRESKAVRWFAAAASVGALLALLLAAAGMWQTLPSLREQGWLALFVCGLSAVGVTFSAIDWRTRGRYHLAPLSLALALGTVLLGLASTLAGFALTLKGVGEPKIMNDPNLYRAIITEGAWESLGSLATASVLSAVQLTLWALARRRALADHSRLR
jgi:eukaryotic-like serine/threonine-protein kinase